MYNILLLYEFSYLRYCTAIDKIVNVSKNNFIGRWISQLGHIIMTLCGLVVSFYKINFLYDFILEFGMVIMIGNTIICKAITASPAI